MTMKGTYAVYVDGGGMWIVDLEPGGGMAHESMFSSIVRLPAKYMYPARAIEQYMCGEAIEDPVDPDRDPALYRRIAELIREPEEAITVCRLEYAE
jgi:hypothetical protein